jgi:MFS family permease
MPQFGGASGAAYAASLAPQELAGRYAGVRRFTIALGLVLAPIIGIPLLTWTPVALGTFCLLAGLLAAVLSATLRPTVTYDQRAPTAITANPAVQAAQNRSA